MRRANCTDFWPTQQNFYLKYVNICIFKLEIYRNWMFILFSNIINWEKFFPSYYHIFETCNWVGMLSWKINTVSSTLVISRVISDIDKFRTHMSETPTYLSLCYIILSVRKPLENCYPDVLLFTCYDKVSGTR
jgi:hypothetical protein